MSRIFLALALVPFAAVGARADGDNPEPPARGIQGTWTVTRVIGDKGPPPGDLSLIFTKDKISVSMMKQVDKAHKYKLDPKKKPGHLDMTDNNGKTVAGIYKIEKGELFICIGERTNRRPTDFTGKEEPVIVLKRQKK